MYERFYVIPGGVSRELIVTDKQKQMFSAEGESVYVSKSDIHGQGLFAGKTFDHGDKIISSFKNGVINKYAKKINHSDNPNAILKLQKPDELSQSIHKYVKGDIIATKRINPKEEVTVNYGTWNKTAPLKFKTKDFRDDKALEKYTLDEIAGIIVNKKDKFIKYLDDKGVACSCVLNNFSNAGLGNYVIENLPDKEFQKAIVEFIEGGDYSNIEPVTVAAIIGLISATVGGGLGLGKTALERKKAKEEAKEKYKQDLQKRIIEKEKEVAKKKRETGMWVAGGVIVALTAIIVSFSILKKGQKQLKTA